MGHSILGEFLSFAAIAVVAWGINTATSTAFPDSIKWEYSRLTSFNTAHVLLVLGDGTVLTLDFGLVIRIINFALDTLL
jgi:hypothetical protein